MLTQERLREILNYNELTGIFIWKASRGTAKLGSAAGGVHKHSGYVRIRVDGALYLAHRLVWLYAHGVWPTDQIDHKNLIKTDNSIANLRDVSNRQNQQNLQCHANGRLGGTCFHKRNQKWIAQIYISGKKKHLGYFRTEQLAHHAYLKAVAKLGDPSV